MGGYLNVHMMLGAVQLAMAGLGIALVTYFDSTCQGVLTDEALNILLIIIATSQVRLRRRSVSFFSFSQKVACWVKWGRGEGRGGVLVCFSWCVSVCSILVMSRRGEEARLAGAA